MTGLEWREAVWRLCEGRCIATGVAVPVEADSWIWNSHHAIKEQTLLRHSVSTVIPQAGVVLTRRAHERHTNRFEVVRFEQLPAYVVEFAASLGPWAEDALAREHPRALAVGRTESARHLSDKAPSA